MTAHFFVLALLGVATTLRSVQALRDGGDYTTPTLVRWGLLYTVAVLVPCAWSLAALRSERYPMRLAVAPAYVGMVTLVAGLSLIGPRRVDDPVVLGTWTALALGAVLAVAATTRWAGKRG